MQTGANVWTANGANVWTTNGANACEGRERLDRERRERMRTGANVWTANGANGCEGRERLDRERRERMRTGANVWTASGANVWTTNGANGCEGRERETARAWPGSRWFVLLRAFVVQRARTSQRETWDSRLRRPRLVQLVFTFDTGAR